jgi:hypothetical protein
VATNLSSPHCRAAMQGDFIYRDLGDVQSISIGLE